MRWCAEDLGLSLRWHTKGVRVLGGANGSLLPCGGKPARYQLRWKAIEVSVCIVYGVGNGGWRGPVPDRWRSSGRNQSSSLNSC